LLRAHTPILLSISAQAFSPTKRHFRHWLVPFGSPRDLRGLAEPHQVGKL